MTDTALVSILVAVTLGALSFILGGDVLLALAVLAAGFVTAFGLVCLLCTLPSPPQLGWGGGPQGRRGDR